MQGHITVYAYPPLSLLKEIRAILSTLNTVKKCYCTASYYAEQGGDTLQAQIKQF